MAGDATAEPEPLQTFRLVRGRTANAVDAAQRQHAAGPAGEYFLFAPASLYPHPEARLVDREGRTVHVWSSDEEQPLSDDEPPSFLRGWNHVELDEKGDLFAVVPLHALLKLDPGSNVVWKALISAHHDLAIAPDGRLYVLCEEPAFVSVDDREHLILDHPVTIVDRDGSIQHSFSLYDVLTSDARVRSVVEDEIRRRYDLFSPDGWPRPGAHVCDPSIVRVNSLLASPNDHDDNRRAMLRCLRELPGSPCDVLHPNTIELLDAHPDGLWDEGHFLLALRSLDLVVVVDLWRKRVVWQWGTGELSGPHQPSAVPNGNVLIFDNGAIKARSRLLEVNPGTRLIEWEYVANPPKSFFTEVAGGCERLPNSNVLATDAQAARMFEVSRDGRVLWEHVVSDVPTPTNPHRTTLYRVAAVDASIVASLGRGKGGAESNSPGIISGCAGSQRNRG